ncbi:hypothetical protein BKA61DRAFT_695487 [Leptodontidium sp. MPI-SDFR-AT-0119]|nr:hypothetical protein BKA61DRAFT_695487 [Leptodontidium sp. MPI-SDFR-AT-0119]
MDNGTYTDSELNHLSSLGIYGAKHKPDVLLTSGRPIANCFIEYCLAAPNGWLPAFIQTALGPYDQNDQDDSSLAHGLGPYDGHGSRVGGLEFPSTYNSVCARPTLFSQTNRSSLNVSDQLHLATALTCLIDICTPSSQANPDIAGIGVVASIVMQLVFAYIFTAYSIFTYSRNLFVRLTADVEGRQTQSVCDVKISHSQLSKYHWAICIVIVDFFKAQCYFSYAIEFACLAFLANLKSSGNVGDFVVIDQICASITPPVIATLSAINMMGHSS